MPQQHVVDEFLRSLEAQVSEGEQTETEKGAGPADPFKELLPRLMGSDVDKLSDEDVKREMRYLFPSTVVKSASATSEVCYLCVFVFSLHFRRSSSCSSGSQFLTVFFFVSFYSPHPSPIRNLSSSSAG